MELIARRWLGMALLALGQVTVSGALEGAELQDERPLREEAPDVEKALIQWVAMWNSYDLSLVDKLFLKDVTYFSSERDDLLRGLTALREHHAAFGFIKGGKVQSNKLWLDGVQIRDHGLTSVVTGVWYFQKSDGSPAQRGPVTFVYVKIDDEYRIAHAHFADAAA